MSQRFTELVFHLSYRELGMCFGGSVICWEGLSVVDEIDFSDVEYEDDNDAGWLSYEDEIDEALAQAEGRCFEAYVNECEVRDMAVRWRIYGDV